MILDISTTELTKIYVELGALGLGFIILIATFILVTNNLVKKSNDQSDLIKDLLKKKEEDNKELMTQFVNQVTNHVPTPQEQKVANKTSETIDIQLKQLLNDISASRVVLVQYHNGTRGFSQHSFMKMSVTNEAHLPNVKPLTNVFQDQMKSLFNKSLTILDEQGEYVVEHLEDIKDVDESMYWFMSERQDKQAFHLSIRDKYGNPIGYLLALYSLNNPVTQTKEIVIPKMKSVRTLIEFILQSNQE